MIAKQENTHDTFCSYRRFAASITNQFDVHPDEQYGVEPQSSANSSLLTCAVHNTYEYT